MFIRCKHTCAIIHICTALSWIPLFWPTPSPCFPLCLSLTPCMSKPPLFYLLGDPSFGDRGANIHPLSSLVSNQLFTPCFLTLPGDTQRFMLHVYIDDITTSATLSDTVPKAPLLVVFLYLIFVDDSLLTHVCRTVPNGGMNVIKSACHCFHQEWLPWVNSPRLLHRLSRKALQELFLLPYSRCSN